MSTYRVETFSRWKLFCGHFSLKKKFDLPKFYEEREHAEEFLRF